METLACVRANVEKSSDLPVVYSKELSRRALAGTDDLRKGAGFEAGMKVHQGEQIALGAEAPYAHAPPGVRICEVVTS